MSDASTGHDLKPLSIGEILDKGFNLYRQRFGDLVKATVVILIPVQILLAFVQVVLETSVTDLETQLEDPNATITTSDFISGGDVALIILTVLLSVVASQLALAACFKILSGTYLGGVVDDWRSSLGFAMSKLGPLLWLMLLSGILLVLAFLALVVPGIYFMIAWQLAVPVLLLEGVKGRKSLGRSRRLVQGSWWRVFGLLFISGILTSLIAGAFSGVFQGIVGETDNDVTIWVSSFITNSLSSGLTTPLGAAFILVLYVDMRVRKEGFDIQRQVESPDGYYPSTGLLPPEPTAPPVTSGEDPPFWPPPPGWKPSS